MMYIVIGGSSFIGAYTVQALLDAGHEVATTGRNPRFAEHYARLGVSYLSFDLTDPHACDKLPAQGVEGVALLAALLPANSTSDMDKEDNSADYIRANAEGTARIAEWCRIHGVPRVITACSYADVQLSWSADRPMREDWKRNFRFTGDHAMYVISKNAANDTLEYYNQQHGMHNASFRLPPVYGVGPHNSLLVDGVRRMSGAAVFIERAKAGEPITVFGDASVCRDIVYVKDVAAAYVKALESESASGLYNIGSGVATSLIDQAEAIADVFEGERGRSTVTIDLSRPNGLTPYSMDISKARDEFGYEPQYTDFRSLMCDWKFEEERGAYGVLFGQER